MRSDDGNRTITPTLPPRASRQPNEGNAHARMRSPPQDGEVTERAQVDVVDGAANEVPARGDAVGERARAMGDVEERVRGEREGQDRERLARITHEGCRGD